MSVRHQEPDFRVLAIPMQKPGNIFSSEFSLLVHSDNVELDCLKVVRGECNQASVILVVVVVSVDEVPQGPGTFPVSRP